MKRSIYQKLLMSLAIVAFFGTFASVQIINRAATTSESTEVEEQELKIEKSGIESEPVKATMQKGQVSDKPRVRANRGLRRDSGSRAKLQQSEGKNSMRITYRLDKNSEAYQKKYKQNVTDKMNAADNEEDRKKYKAILESLK